jgi:hypothetical protein
MEGVPVRYLLGTTLGRPVHMDVGIAALRKALMRAQINVCDERTVALLSCLQNVHDAFGVWERHDRLLPSRGNSAWTESESGWRRRTFPTRLPRRLPEARTPPDHLPLYRATGAPYVADRRFRAEAACRTSLQLRDAAICMPHDLTPLELARLDSIISCCTGRRIRSRASTRSEQDPPRPSSCTEAAASRSRAFTSAAKRSSLTAGAPGTRLRWHRAEESSSRSICSKRCAARSRSCSIMFPDDERRNLAA